MRGKPMTRREKNMNTAFVQPKFIGSRFERHTLPVDIARDLAAYEALLIALAKHLYLQDHPDRQRVPKGFSDTHLDIVSIEEGSSKPVLALTTAAISTLPLQLPLFPDIENSYFSKSRDLIAECIAAHESALPNKFPKELLSYFNQLGRSLKDGETMELSQANKPQTAVLSPEKRKKLVLAVNKVYEREVELSGSIVEADWEKSTFRLRLMDGSQTTVPMTENFHDKVRQSGGRIRDCAFIKGIAAYDSWERLQKVLVVESLEIIKNSMLTVRFDELSQLEDGWDNGQGIAPKRGLFETVAKMLIDSYPENSLLPSIVPTQTGNLLLEWDAIGDPSVDIDLDTMEASFHAFGQNETDLDADFSLIDTKSYAEFFAFLSENIKSREI
jgi:hypothetical protein